MQGGFAGINTALRGRYLLVLYGYLSDWIILFVGQA